MVKFPNYYPVLKWKAGERDALQALTAHQRQMIAPIIEVVDDIPVSTLIETLVPLEQPIIVDTVYIDNERTMIRDLVSQSKELKGIITPLLYLNDLEEFASEFLNNSERIVVVLPIPEDIAGPSNSYFFEYITDWESSPQIDLILDLGILTEAQDANTAYALLNLFFKTFEDKLARLNRIIIRCSSFPIELASIQSGESSSFPRYDMRIFKKLAEDSKKQPYFKQLGYSDYGVTKFTETELDFSRLQYGVLPKVKYTKDDSYLVLKGQKDHKRGEWIISYKDLAKTIVESDFYYGQDFSYGDKEIFDISLDNPRMGSNRNWVAYCANHHIAVVIDQLSKIL